MEKKYRVVGIAPTHWQKNKLTMLSGEVPKPWGNKFGIEKFFETKEDAIDWLHNRNEYLFELSWIEAEKYEYNTESIKNHYVVSLDDVYLKIEVVEGGAQ